MKLALWLVAVLVLVVGIVSAVGYHYPPQLWTAATFLVVVGVLAAGMGGPS